MDLSLWSIKINNWSADNFKKHFTLMSCKLEPVIQSCDIGQWYPFWQLSIDHNINVHKDVHYQIKHTLYMSWTPNS